MKIRLLSSVVLGCCTASTYYFLVGISQGGYREGDSVFAVLHGVPNAWGTIVSMQLVSCFLFICAYMYLKGVILYINFSSSYFYLKMHHIFLRVNLKIKLRHVLIKLWV